MNIRMVLFILGQMIIVEAGLLLLPMIVAVLYSEACIKAFAISIFVCVLVGLFLVILMRPKSKVIFAKEGFVIVALSWLVMSAFGALPFWISGEIPSYIDAFFETVSGFTTTGSSILTDVEAMSHGLLFWRSFTHWVGGMGVLVFMMAIIPGSGDRTIHIMRAEMPGPIVGKLVPKARETARILYLIYVVMTALEIILLLCGGMTLFESVVHSFGTAGTGGFGIKADSIASYSHYLQWVITVFMLLFGINFNIYYLLLIRRSKNILQSTEMWVYLSVIAVSVTAITINILHMCQNLSEAIRLSVFQVASIITTTGYSTTDFDLWPSLSKTLILVLMLMGACAGSTGGGFKVARVVILCKKAKNEIRHLLHPRSVTSVRFEGKQVEQATLHNLGNYLTIYVAIIIVMLILVSFDNFDIETNLSAVISCINNIGPGFAKVGPMCSFAEYSWFSKIILSFGMLFGRLEIFPMLILFIPSTWTKD